MASPWKLDTTKIWCRYFKHLQTKSSDKLQHITYNMECHAKKEDDQHRTASDSNKTDGSKDNTCSGLLQAARSNPTVIFWMSIDVLINKTSAREKFINQGWRMKSISIFQISKLHRLEILSLFPFILAEPINAKRYWVFGVKGFSFTLTGFFQYASHLRVGCRKWKIPLNLPSTIFTPSPMSSLQNPGATLRTCTAQWTPNSSPWSRTCGS